MFCKINTLSTQSTSHQGGTKKVILTKEDCASSVTQVAVAILKKDEHIERHMHPTMEEFFYCQTGLAKFVVGEEEYLMEKDAFLLIPAGVSHMIQAIEGTQLLYWGVAIEEK